jgi:hypothetical protein
LLLKDSGGDVSETREWPEPLEPELDYLFKNSEPDPHKNDTVPQN